MWRPPFTAQVPDGPARSGHETVQILEVPGLPADGPTGRVQHGGAVVIDQDARGESVAASLLLTDIPPCPMYESVIELVEEDKQHQFIGLGKINGVEFAPPVRPVGLRASDVRLQAVGIAVFPAQIDVDAIGLVVARA